MCKQDRRVKFVMSNERDHFRVAERKSTANDNKHYLNKRRFVTLYSSEVRYVVLVSFEIFPHGSLIWIYYWD